MASRPTIDITPSTITTSPSNGPTSAAPSPKTTSCPDRPDIYLWMRTPGVPDYPPRLGGTTITNCEPNYKLLMSTAPTTLGSRTQLVQVSDNPGYNPDATSAKRLKKVEYSVGPAG